MTYQETLDFLFSQLPMYQNKGKVAYKKDLSNTLKLCEILDHPEKKIRCIHIAGTNGKGSIAHMLASIFQEAGYQTGLYTSPHLKDFRERVKVNGQMIPKQDVVNFIETYKTDFQAIQPSFFEWTVALAFNHFANIKVDIAIIETGLGGRLDSTNVISPDLSVISNISFDHMDMLGNTLTAIATEKAGIIKPNTPVVIGNPCGEEKVFENKAVEVNAELHYANEFQTELQLKSDLIGNYQEENIKTVYAASQVAIKKGWKISEKHIVEGLTKVVQNTGLKGRWQVLRENPRVIADTAHNEAGLKIVINQLLEQKFDKLHIVLGVVKDKNVEDILDFFPVNAKYYFCQAAIPRALPSDELKEKASHKNLIGNHFKSVNQAYQAALQASTKTDLIFVGGSTFTVAEIV